MRTLAFKHHAGWRFSEPLRCFTNEKGASLICVNQSSGSESLPPPPVENSTTVLIPFLKFNNEKKKKRIRHLITPTLV